MFVALDHRSESPDWKQLTIPSVFFGPLGQVDSAEFFVVDVYGEKCIHKYNKSQNWTKIDLNYSTDFEQQNYCIDSNSINNVSETIYMCNKNQLFTINTQNGHCDMLPAFNVSQVPWICNINGMIHCIIHNEHHIYNTKTKKCEKNCDFPVTAMVASVIYIKSKQMFLARHIQFDNDQTFCGISEFSLSTNKWTHNKQDTPSNLISSMDCSVITKDGQYVFYVGLDHDASTNKMSKSDQLLIYDVKCEEWKKCSIKLPVKSKWYIKMLTDEYRDEVLTFGFMKEVYNESSMKNIMDLPRYIVKWVQELSYMENVHVIGFDEKTWTQHWKINVDKIIQAAKKRVVIAMLNASTKTSQWYAV